MPRAQFLPGMDASLRAFLMVPSPPADVANRARPCAQLRRASILSAMVAARGAVLPLAAPWRSSAGPGRDLAAIRKSADYTAVNRAYDVCRFKRIFIIRVPPINKPAISA